MAELIEFLSESEIPAEAVEIRVLTAEEVESVRPVFEEQDADMPNPGNSFFMGAVKDGQVVAFLVVQLQVHAEPMWISPGHENVFQRLAHATEREISARAGVVDVFLFAPAGKIARLAQMCGMRVEPWVVLSKRVVPEGGTNVVRSVEPSKGRAEQSGGDEQSGPEQPVPGSDWPGEDTGE